MHKQGARGVGLQRLVRIYDVFLVRMGTLDEGELSDSFEAMISYLGDTLAGDEKLFRHTGSSGFVRMCPNKPAKMGIWSYRAVVFLTNGMPFLVYTKAHLAPSALDMTVHTHSLVRDWADICRRFKSSAVLVMDSYYLSAPGRSILNDQKEKVHFIAALKRDRFQKINAFLEPTIKKSGDTAVIFNESRGEAAVYHWSLDTNIGKKLVMSNAFAAKKAKRQPKGCIFIYDHDNWGCIPII